MFLERLRALLQLVHTDLNERGSSGSYDLDSDCLLQLSRCALNKLRAIVTERPMSPARAFHILTVRMKNRPLICSCFAFFWEQIELHLCTLLLDLVALEKTRLVGITVRLTLTSPVTDLKKKIISRYSCQ